MLSDPLPQPISTPLAGVRVLDIVSGGMALTGRVFADFGALVTRVDFQNGGQERSDPDRAITRTDIEQLALGRGKLALGIDRAVPADRDRLLNAIRDCDILINDGGLAALEDARFANAALQAANPALIILNLSDFGEASPLACWRATNPVLHALSGGLSRSGRPGHPPVMPPEAIATACAAVHAAFVALLAFAERLESGRGDLLDFSILDGVVQALDPGFGVNGSAAAGVRASELPRGRPDVHHQYPIIPCADGYVRLCVLSPRQWQAMFKWMGEPAEFADPAYEQLRTRFNSTTLVPAIARFFADKTRAELEQQGQAIGVPTAALQSADDAIDSDQNRSRQLYEAHSLRGVDIRLPRAPVEVDGTRLPLTTPDRDAQRARAALLSSDTGVPRARSAGPLQGLRVIDMGVIVVGAETGRLLADAGADVIKIENPAFPDGVRQTQDGSVMSPSFAAGGRNKRSLSLNLRDPEGKALFLDLVAQADVLLSNFKPGTLDALGFDDETLRAINPGLVSIQSSAFGSTGPRSRQLGYGPLVRAATGLSALWCSPDDPGSFSDAMTVYPDHVAGRLGALSVLALLVRRRATGTGGQATIAQAEIILDHLGVDMAAASLRAQGQQIDDDPDALWGVYPCGGDDDWCVVTIENDAQWTALARLIGFDGQGVINRSDRARHRPAIEHALTSWLAERSSYEAMERLQASGVPAGAMLRVADMPGFPHFASRGFFREIAHPAILEPFLVEARPVRAQNMPDPDQAPAPLIGQDSDAVLSDWLRLSPSQVQDLTARNIIGTIR